LAIPRNDFNAISIEELLNWHELIRHSFDGFLCHYSSYEGALSTNNKNSIKNRGIKIHYFMSKNQFEIILTSKPY